MFSFVTAQKSTSCNARTGILNTPHGSIETPNFIFCATKAAFKCVSPAQIRDLGTDIILANTYHLMVNGGAEIMEKCGGIHKFMGWNGPILTDSGGFQIFSLGHGSVADEIKRRQNSGRERSLIKITSDGALFRSHIDGRQFFLSPEKSMQVQRSIGSDLVLALDECTPFHVDKSYTERSMYMSHAWELRSLEEFKKLNVDSSQAIYGIVQGGIYQDLREVSADFVSQNNFFGIAIGGSLGGEKSQMQDVVSHTCSRLEESKPRHLLGVGLIPDILDMVSSGIDTFDCVHPTRVARHGLALIKGGKGLNMRNSCFKDDFNPLDSNCPCSTCLSVSRAYLHYLFRIGEPLAMIMLTTHNGVQMNRLMRDIRSAIMSNTLPQLRHEWMPQVE